MPLTHTISLVELIWTVVSLAALYYTGKVFSRAMGDWVNLKLNRINSIREFAARVVVLTYGLFAVVALGFVIAGGVAMLSPSHHVTFAGYTLTIVFLTLDVLLASTSWVIEKWRRMLLQKIREIDDVDWYFRQKDEQEGVVHENRTE